MAKKKKTSMAKEVEKTEEGEQMDLIDVAPEKAKDIVAAARVYKNLQNERLGALEKECKQKQKVLDLVHKAGIQADTDGTINFNYKGVTIKVKPRDELITIKEKSEKDESG